MALRYSVARQSWGPSGSLRWLLGGSEDPWHCVSDFGQVCLYHNADCPTIAKVVNSGMCLLMSALGQ